MDTLSATLQSTAFVLGFGESFFKDRFTIFGKEYNGRKLARAFLISAVSLLAADSTIDAANTKKAKSIAGAITLWVITGRALALRILPNETDADRNRRGNVTKFAFASGETLSLGGQWLATGGIAGWPTVCSTFGLGFGCLMDFQDKQENANRLLFAAGTSWFIYGLLTDKPGLIAKTLCVDMTGNAINTYRNFISPRYEGPMPWKLAVYTADTARDISVSFKKMIKRDDLKL